MNEEYRVDLYNDGLSDNDWYPHRKHLSKMRKKSKQENKSVVKNGIEDYFNGSGENILVSDTKDYLLRK